MHGGDRRPVAEKETVLTRPSSDVAFTPAVKAVQESRGSRGAYARREAQGGFATDISPELATFIAARDSVYLATASAEGQPYVQHRGGPAGFLQVLGPRQLGFADLPGNRQFITLGNLSENPRAFLFLMDYEHRRRVKIWGRARVVTGDPALLEQLRVPGRAPDQAIVFDVESWDTNCPQYIPLKLGAAEVERALAERDQKIEHLEAELARLRGPPPG